MLNYTNIQRVRNKVNLGLYERIPDLVKYFLLISQYEFKTELSRESAKYFDERNLTTVARQYKKD